MFINMWFSFITQTYLKYLLSHLEFPTQRIKLDNCFLQMSQAGAAFDTNLCVFMSGSIR